MLAHQTAHQSTDQQSPSTSDDVTWTTLRDLPGNWQTHGFAIDAALEIAVATLRQLDRYHTNHLVFGELNEDLLWIASNCTVELQEVVLQEGERLSRAPVVNSSTPSMCNAQYLAPEQTGVLSRELSASTDLYAVGILLFRLLTGSLPFRAENLSDLLLEQATATVKSLRLAGCCIPRALDEVVLRLLKRDPLDRYQSATAVIDDLVQIRAAIVSDSSVNEIAIGLTDRRSRFASSSLVGRTAEVGQFQRLIAADGSIEQRPWIIWAQSGEGKTRLLDEFAKVAAAKAIPVLMTCGAISEHARPLESFTNLFKDFQRVCSVRPNFERKLHDELLEHRESLHSVLPWLFSEKHAAPLSLGPSKFAGRRLKQAIARLLDWLASQDAKLVVLIDNLDHCDELSRSLLVNWIHTQRQRPSGSIILVATASPEQVSVLAPIAIDSNDHLKRMDREDLIRLLKSMTGQFPPEILERVADKARHNPYMAVSLLYGLIESGSLVSDQHGWSVRSSSQITLQSDRNCSRIIASRAAGLSRDDSSLLEAAAILGIGFRFEEAASLARLEPRTASAALAQALERQLVWSDVTQTNLGFVHDDIRQLFLVRLDERKKRALHLRAARLILGTHEDRCFELAHHFGAASHAARAVEFSLLAAKQAQAKYVGDLAIRYYRIAQKWLGADDRDLKMSICEGLGEVYLSIGKYAEAETILRQAIESAAGALERTRIMGMLGDVEFKRGRMSSAAERYSEALAFSGVRLPSTACKMLWHLTWELSRQACHSILGRPTQLAPASALQRLQWNLFSRLAHTYWFSKGPLWTLTAHLRGMNEAEYAQDTPELAKSYSDHAPVCSLLGSFRRADKYSHLSLGIRSRLNDVWGRGQTLSYSSVVQLAAGRFQACVEVATEAIELLERTGDAWETNMARYQKANALYRLGRFREAAIEAQRMYSLGSEIGDEQASGISLDVWIRAAPAQVPPKYVEAQALIERTDAQSHAQTQLALAILRVRQNRCEDAAAILTEAIQRCKRAGHLNAYISPCYAWLATTYRMAAIATPRHQIRLFEKRLQLASRVARRACRVARRFPADLAHAYRELGQVTAFTGQEAQARKWYRRSVRFAHNLSCAMEEYQSLQCLHELARHSESGRVRISQWELRRLRELQEQLTEAIALLDSQHSTKETLSLADRFDKLLADGRRISRSLNKLEICREGCVAAQHLLRGQMVCIAARQNDEQPWQVVEHLYSDCQSALLTPDLSLFWHYIASSCQDGETRKFNWDGLDGVSRGSILAVPIRTRDSIVACLVVAHAEISDLFGDAELQIAEFIATLTGAALENSEGFADLQDLNRNLEQRVAERTAAAEQRAQELNTSNQALIRTEEQLREAISVATAASQAKSQFLATMSHEIRTPLNGILGMTQLALAAEPEQQQVNYLTTIQRSGDSLLKLLNDLLDFSKIEAGKMTTESIPIDPRKLLTEALEVLSITAWQKGIELVAHFDSSLPKILLGDSFRLRQVVLNLVGNAIKFTSSGHVEVRADVPCENDKTPARWRIQVIDTGIGIPQAQQAKIFEAFSQADNSTTRRFGGTGLGLSISSELIELMGGTIEVSSREGAGSVFSILLPLTSSGQEGACSVPRFRIPGARALVLEPNEAARSSLQSILQTWGIRTIAISSWSELEFCDRPDLELFDMVFAAGPEAGELIEKANASSVAGWLAQGLQEHSPNGFRSLTKPIFPNVLEYQLRKYLSEQQLANCHRAINPETAPESTDSMHANSSLHVLVAEDGVVNQMVLVGLLELQGHRVTVAQNGYEASQLVFHETFDACLMDLDMPEMDGIEATKLIRQTNCSLIILAMTAHHDEHHARLCDEAGMNGYLTKPIDPVELNRILATISSAVAGRC